MRRIASAGVLIVAMTLSLMAITRSETESFSVPVASGGDRASVAVLAADVTVAPAATVGEVAAAPTLDAPAVAPTSSTVEDAVAVVAETTTASVLAVEVIAAPVVDARRPRPTTTTSPPSTTTTVTDPTTTTTINPETTTTAVPVTTTTAGGLPKPTGDKFVTMLVGQDGEWWLANYFRNLPYTPGTGWTDGDRSAYRCMYAFLTQDSAVVGRVTFMRVDAAASYSMINDREMAEGRRYYDGSLAGPGAPKELGQCPRAGADYTPYEGPTQLPTITFGTTGGSLLEVRNYKTVVAVSGITFQQTESTDQRVTVVAYFNNLPVIVVYYDSMVPNVVMNSDLG